MCKGRTKTVIGKVEVPNLFRARSATACSPRFICMLDYPERSLSEVKPTLTRWHCEATPRERVFSRRSVILGKFKAGRLHPKSRSMCSRCASWTSLKSKATWRSCSGRKTAIGWYIMRLISSLQMEQVNKHKTIDCISYSNNFSFDDALNRGLAGPNLDHLESSSSKQGSPHQFCSLLSSAQAHHRQIERRHLR